MIKYIDEFTDAFMHAYTNIESLNSISEVVINKSTNP